MFSSGLSISDALRDLVPFVQFKKREKQPLLQPATLLKVTPMRVFHVF